MACEIKDPTNNPICSDSIQDLKHNAIIFDQYINSEEFVVPDRLGVERATWAGLEFKVNDAIDSAVGAIRLEWQTGLTNISDKEAQSLASIEQAKQDAIDEILETGGVEVLQNTGQSTTAVMSQKAVTDFVGDAVPVGAVQAFIGETAPNDKWLLCRGQAFSAESYPDLAQPLPALKIPDLRGVALRGLDANRGFDPDRALLSYQEDAIQKITGNHGSVLAEGSYGAFSAGQTSTNKGWATTTTSVHKINLDSSLVTRSNTQDETVMKNVAVNFIIKAR